ncbi:unnamed protein product, partial [Staurois parvus]
CGTPDVQEDRTSVRNISLTQDRKVASPSCAISDVWKGCISLKTFPHTLRTGIRLLPSDRNMVFPLCEISDVCKDETSVKNISHTQDSNKASPPCEISDD